MSIALASIVVLVLIALVAVPILYRVVSTAGQRNKNRPDDSSDREEGGISDESRPSDEEMHREEEAIKSLGPLIGGAIALGGLLTGLAGGIFGVWQFTVMDAIPAASMGIFLGLVGYFLGARGLGKAAAIVSTAAIIFAMAVGQGYVPGLNATDRGLPAAEPRSATN